MSTGIVLALPDELVERVAQRVVELLREQRQYPEPSSKWLDVEGACRYLSLTRNTLYKLSAAGAIPARRKAGGQGLRFHQDELDEWVKEAYPRVDNPRNRARLDPGL